MKKILPALVFGIACGALLAQPGQRGYLSTGLSYQSWTIENTDDPIEQTAGPLVAAFPVSKRFMVHFSNLPAASQFGGTKLSGLSDTWIKTTYVFPSGHFMLHFGLGAPTGKTGLTDSEFYLSQMLAENLFQFRLPIYGQGLSVKWGAAAALPLSPKTVLGFGVHTVSKNAYHPLENDEIEFRSGGETSVFTGLDVKLGSMSKWSIDVLYTVYGKDRLNGESVYASGAKLSVSSRLNAALGKSALSFSLRFRQRGKSEYWTGTSMELEEKNSNGDQTEMDVDWQIVRWPRGALSLLGAGRFYSNNQYRLGKANVAGGGVGLTLRLSTKTSFSAAVRSYSGALQWTDDNIQVKGLDAAGVLTFEL